MGKMKPQEDREIYLDYSGSWRSSLDSGRPVIVQGTGGPREPLVTTALHPHLSEPLSSLAKDIVITA